METLIPARFNGPPDSGNGGYSCGVLAAHIEGPARVRLHVPPPLDATLTITEAGDGQVDMSQGATLVASAWPAELDLDIPLAPSLAQARDARERFIAWDDHYLPTCFVCGPGRPAHDGLELFPGPVTDWSLLACPWQPAADMLDSAGNVREEVVWGALDCPGYFAAGGENPPVALLGELVGEIRQPVPGAEELVVYAWPMGQEGRKSWGGTAIANQAGEILAASRSLWITLK